MFDMPGALSFEETSTPLPTTSAPLLSRRFGDVQLGSDDDSTEMAVVIDLCNHTAAGQPDDDERMPLSAPSTPKQVAMILVDKDELMPQLPHAMPTTPKRAVIAYVDDYHKNVDEPMLHSPPAVSSINHPAMVIIEDDEPMPQSSQSLHAISEQPVVTDPDSDEPMSKQSSIVLVDKDEPMPAMSEFAIIDHCKEPVTRTPPVGHSKQPARADEPISPPLLAIDETKQPSTILMDENEPPDEDHHKEVNRPVLQTPPVGHPKRPALVVVDDDESIPQRRPVTPKPRVSTAKDSHSSPDKCRHREVDHSITLHEQLYGKEESIGRLRNKMCEQGRAFVEKQKTLKKRYEGLLESTLQDYQGHSETMLGLQTSLQEKETELTMLWNKLREQSKLQEQLQAQMLNDQQQAAQKHASNLEHLRKQFALDIQSQMDAMQASKTTEIESLVQERVVRVDEARTEQTSNDQRQAAQKHASDLENLKKKFALDLKSQMEAMQTLRAAEVESLVKERVARFQETIQAEKECELASIEQRYSQRTKYASHNHLAQRHAERDLQMECDPPAAQGRQSDIAQPTRQHSPYMPSLNAIKRIRKARGISTRTHLIGIDVEDPEPQPSTETPIPLEGTGNQTSPPNLPVEMSLMMDAITKGVEGVIRSIFVNGSQFTMTPTPTPSPRRRKHKDEALELEKKTDLLRHRSFILGEVRRLLKDKLGIAQDIDIITHEAAIREDVHEYEHEDGPAPDNDQPAFDFSRNHSSLWNTYIIELFVRELQERCTKENWPIAKSDNYIRDILKDRYKRLRTTWLNAQPKLTSRGTVESAAETESRLIEDRMQVAKGSRQATRRRNKYHRRITVLQYMIAMKSEGQAPPNLEEPDLDLASWRWLHHLIQTLGEHGMSSEESSVENSIENVLPVKQMDWRRNIDRELEIIDRERTLDCDIFCAQGSKPLLRKRATNNPITSRNPVRRLPLALYDSAWLLQLTERQSENLAASKVKFPWMKVVVA